MLIPSVHSWLGALCITKSIGVSLSSTSSIRPFLTTLLYLLSARYCSNYLSQFIPQNNSVGWLLLICSVMSNSLQPHRLQHARLPRSSASSGACSNSCQLSQVMPSNHLILCRPLLLLPSIFPSIRVFSNELALHTRWPKYWSFIISPSNEYSVLISFRIDWFDLAVQGTLKSLLQHHSSKESILWHSAFFMALLNIFILLTRKLRHRGVK